MNRALEDMELPYMIKSKIVKVNKERFTVWIVEYKK